MTMMAAINPALSRLFERVDSAPAPDDRDLSALLERWRKARAGAATPSTAAFIAGQGEPLRQTYGLFEIVAGDNRDYGLAEGSDAVAGFLGARLASCRLKEAPERRAAVRLRRLLDAVRSSGEPLLARFEARDASKQGRLVEILILPLSQDQRSVSAFVCAIRERTTGTISSPITGRGKPQADVLIFAQRRDGAFAAAIAARLGIELSPLEERDFEDGEHKIRPLVDVRGRDVVVVAGLNAGEGQSVNDRLCRLLFLIGCLKTNGAASVWAVTPYLCYLRKDRQTKAWDPLTGRYVAQLIEAAGADGLITMEAHNLAAFQNAFRIPTVHLEPYSCFAEALMPDIGDKDVTVMSPDLGGGKRADLFREVLEKRLGRPVGAALMEKHRSLGVVSGEMFAGDVENRTVVILDDMIGSGTTMARAAEACRAHGAREVYLAATHGLFSPGSEVKLGGAHIRRTLIANTIQPPRIPAGLEDRVAGIDVTGPFADCIRHLHR